MTEELKKLRDYLHAEKPALDTLEGVVSDIVVKNRSDRELLIKLCIRTGVLQSFIQESTHDIIFINQCKTKLINNHFFSANAAEKAITYCKFLSLRKWNFITVENIEEYVATERVTLGTVASLFRRGDIVKLIPGTVERYLDGTNKAIGLILINAKGESTTLSCSKKVSKAMVEALEAGKEMKLVLSTIVKLEVTQFKSKSGEIMQTISAPVGEGGDELEITVTDAVKINFEDLI